MTYVISHGVDRPSMNQDQVGVHTQIPVRKNIDLIVERASKRVFSRSDITCFRCGDQGHFRSECIHWKTRICKAWNENATCAEGSDCAFAHGEGDIRFPRCMRCVRVVKHSGQVRLLGCGEFGHTFRNCPRKKKVEVRCEPVLRNHTE